LYPEEWHFFVAPYIDKFVKWLVVAWGPFFDAIANFVLSALLSVEHFLKWVPWWVWIIVVILLSWRLTHSWFKTLLPGALIFTIGMFGLWEVAMETLGIVIIAVLISLVIGIPVGIAMLTSVFPPQERGRVLGINGAVVYAGLTLGPVLGGALTHNIGWPSIFFLSALIGFAVLGLTLAKLKGEWLGAADESYDLRGAVLYTVGIIAFTYGISTVATSHWARYILGAGIIILIVFARHELKIPSPVLQLRLFRHNAVFSFSLLAALINYCATFAVGFILSLFLQVSLGYNSQVAGFILLAQPIIMALVSPSAGRLSDRIDPRLVASTGMGISTLGLFILIFINPQFPLMVVMLTLVLLGLGTALFASPNNNAVLSAVPKQFLGVASSTLGTARLTGQVTSMALVTLILASCTGNVELSPAYSQLFIKAARFSFIIFTILSVLGIMASLARGKGAGRNQASA
jgi:MFS family permease